MRVILRVWMALALLGAIVARPAPTRAAESRDSVPDAELLLDLELLKDPDFAKRRELLRRLPVIERIRLLENLHLLESQPEARPARKEGAEK